MPQYIGLFGGTFDPPHVGHQILASESRAQLGLDRILWVLTPDPPHKLGQVITPLEHRLAMVKLAIADDLQFELSSIEMDRSGPHYALETVNTIAGKYPSAEVVYIMGGDSLSNLPAWQRPTELVAALKFIGVMRRPGDSLDLVALERSLPGVTAKVRSVNAPLLDIAARDIRQRVAEGRPFRYFLPPSVYDYIIKHDLYR
jgi:nicotinate-nucleotide adenylyltransferase